jgi:hypothetical protein
MSINIKPETLAIIEKQAKLFGLSADEYLRGLLPKTERGLPLEKYSKDEFEADMTAFAENTQSVSNYSENYSREDIYFDHN